MKFQLGLHETFYPTPTTPHTPKIKALQKTKIIK